MDKYVPYLVMVFWVFVFWGGFFFLGRLVRPIRKSVGSHHINKPSVSQKNLVVSSSFQSLLVISVLFMLGILILVPVAVVYRQSVENGLGVRAILSLLFFLATLTMTFAHAWIKGDFTWVH